jgi:uncharacterized protein (DUF1778 family)
VTSVVRDEQVAFRVNPGEKLLLREAALTAGVPLSVFIRLTVLSSARVAVILKRAPRAHA